MVEKILELHKEKTIFWMLLGLLFLCAGFYMYFIEATVRNVVARERVETESSTMTMAVASHEFEYMSLRNQITLSLAYSLGFKDVTDKTFVSKDMHGQVTYAGRN